MAGLTDWQEACAELEGDLEELTDRTQRHKRIVTHLEKCAELNVHIPEFDKDLEWINTERSLSLHEDLKGGLVILDFFTYCCINCIHILPDLEALEHVFPLEKGVVVVGVHSAKFANDKISANILSAVLRYGISHAVVNDSEAKMWNELMIQCWPTLTLVSPHGYLLYNFVGEGHREKLLEFVTVALDFYQSKGEITLSSLPLKPARENLSESPLSFPGKVCCSDDGKNVVVADTGHHRVLLLGPEGIVKHSVGGGKPGFRNGSFTEALFNSPQGVCYQDQVIYVADTENHAIRKIDLKEKTVVTIAGTGRMGEDKQGGQLGVEQAISSPWDVTLGSSLGSSDKNLLLIAMAGSHQIWGLFLKEGRWLKGSVYAAGTCVRLSGSGKEENRNNSYPEKASFAQPSGLTLSKHQDHPLLFLADAESSSIRSMSLRDGAVKALVGGERDPKNLFAYGDQDGKGYDARLQHPLGVTVFSHDPCVLAVADSYNHKIKKIEVATKHCTSYVGNGTAGNSSSGLLREVTLNEPGGLYMDRANGILYIADTNNHSIKTVDVKTDVIRPFPIIFPSDQTDQCDQTDQTEEVVFRRLTRKSTPATETRPVFLTPGGRVTLRVHVDWKPGIHLTEGAPSQWQVWVEENSGNTAARVIQKSNFQDGEEYMPEVIVPVPDSLAQGKTINVFFEAMIYFCDDAGLCKMKGVLHKQCIHLDANSSESHTENIKLTLD